MPLPQPFQLAPRAGSDIAAEVVHFAAAADAAGVAPKGRSARNSATARRSGSVSDDPCTCILPFTSALWIASGVRVRRTSRAGAPALFVA
jgi:hypothetical protein